MNPKLIYCTLVLISFGAHVIFPIQYFIIYPLNLIGLFLWIGGIFLAWYSKTIFIKNGISTKHHENSNKLETSWPFSISRNPMYLGVLISLIGVSVFFGTASSLISAAIFFLIINLKVIPFEETKLENQFGKQYINYKSKVRRWL